MNIPADVTAYQVMAAIDAASDAISCGADSGSVVMLLEIASETAARLIEDVPASGEWKPIEISLERETQKCWSLISELRAAKAAGDAEAVEDCRDELEALALHTDREAVRKMAKAAVAAA